MAKVKIEIDLERGMLFKKEKEVYMLIQTSREEFALIGLKDGNRWKDNALIGELASELVKENFKCIGNVNDYHIKLEEKNNNILNQNGKESDEDFDSNPLKIALDETFDLLDEASKFTVADEKQYFIYLGMKTYCDTFGIPIKELLDNVPIGIKPKR